MKKIFKKNNKKNKITFYTLIAILVFLFFSVLNKNVSKNYSIIKLSDFIKAAKNGKIEKTNILNEMAIGSLNDGSRFKDFFPEIYVGKIIDTLTQENVNYDFTAINGNKSIIEKIFSIILEILSWLPMILISAWFLWPLFAIKKRKKNNGGDDFGLFGNPFSFGKSKAKAMMPNELNVKFSDVAGIDEAKEDVVELVDFLRDPKKYYDIGGKIPRGCLLCGQPGTGKTLLAKAIACEAKVPFFFISGSDFVEMFVGVGASRVRDMEVLAGMMKGNKR